MFLQTKYLYMEICRKTVCGKTAHTAWRSDKKGVLSFSALLVYENKQQAFCNNSVG